MLKHVICSTMLYHSYLILSHHSSGEANQAKTPLLSWQLLSSEL